jgi:hypothetical protein
MENPFDSETAANCSSAIVSLNSDIWVCNEEASVSLDDVSFGSEYCFPSFIELEDPVDVPVEFSAPATAPPAAAAATLAAEEEIATAATTTTATVTTTIAPMMMAFLCFLTKDFV